MKNHLWIPDGKLIRAPFFLAAILCISFLTVKSYAEISQNPRQTGEETLIELLMGPNRFMASVGSNGCTDKGSFKVDVKKEAGSSPQVPHYVLTIRRIKADECKAIVAGGTLVLFDLVKDLGIKGDFTYSITNRVFFSSRVPPADESLLSLIEKYFTAGNSEMKEIK